MSPSFRRPRIFNPVRHGTIDADGFRPRRIWDACVAEEPSLTELMGDPIFGHLLASDGLQPEHVETLISEMRYKLGYA